MGFGIKYVDYLVLKYTFKIRYDSNQELKSNIQFQEETPFIKVGGGNVSSGKVPLLRKECLDLVLAARVNHSIIFDTFEKMNVDAKDERCTVLFQIKI